MKNEHELDKLLKAALLVLSQVPDSVKSIAMSSTAIKACRDPTDAFYVTPGDSFFGIPVKVSECCPKDWMMLDYVSGKKVMFNLVDGRSLELPDPFKIPELEFDFKYCAIHDSKWSKIWRYLG